jgi:hypothetical protein
MSITVESGRWSSATRPAPWINEDWLSLCIGLGIFVLALGGLAGMDVLGWVVSTSVWTDPGQALGTVSKAYAGLGGAGALLVTYLALMLVLTACAAALNLDVKRLAAGFTGVFALGYASWIIGSNAHVAAVTPADLQKFGIDWSLKLTNEGGYVVALLFGLVIANFFPRLAEWLKEAIRPEFYIKIAIVILGAFLAVTAAGKLTLATSILLRGVAAIVEAYLIYWAVVYYVPSSRCRTRPATIPRISRPLTAPSRRRTIASPHCSAAAWCSWLVITRSGSWPKGWCRLARIPII